LLVFFLGRVTAVLRWRWRWCPAVRPGLVAVSASLISTAPRRQTTTRRRWPRQGSAGPPVAGRGAFNSRPQGIRGICACGARVSTVEPAWPRGIGCGRACGAGRPASRAPLAPHQPPVRARATCEANGAGAAARHMQGPSPNAGTGRGSPPAHNSHARFILFLYCIIIFWLWDGFHFVF